MVTPITKYSTYNIKRKNILKFKNKDISNINSIAEKHPSSFIEYNNKNSLFFINRNRNKRIIVVDNEQDILFTYRNFLNDYDYQITSFVDPYLALNYIRDNPSFDDLLVILDIRMKNLNGLQLYQQIKAMDPTIKILFVTALDIIEEILTIVPGLSKEQIMRKPVDKKEFTNTVNKLMN
jgi:DNA-binding NtrC family response regulator